MRYLPSILFFAFICWIIYDADLGNSSWFLTFVKTVPFGDKLGHVGLYGALTLLLNLALRCYMLRVGGASMQLGTVLVMAFALVEELSQGLFPSRTFDGADVVADVVGIVCGAHVAKILRSRF